MTWKSQKDIVVSLYRTEAYIDSRLGKLPIYLFWKSISIFEIQILDCCNILRTVTENLDLKKKKQEA